MIILCDQLSKSQDVGLKSYYGSEFAKDWDLCLRRNKFGRSSGVSQPCGFPFHESTFEISVSTVRMNITIETLRTVEE